MTPGGKARMQKTLNRLKQVERPDVVKAIEVARAHGDLKENAEYHAAKDRQGMIEARIREYEAKLSRAQVIDPTKMSGHQVRFGATVTVLDLDTDKEATYSIVGEDESDYQRNLLNYRSPIAKSILGNEEGDVVVVKLERGDRRFEILEVAWLAIDI